VLSSRSRVVLAVVVAAVTASGVIAVRSAGPAPVPAAQSAPGRPAPREPVPVLLRTADLTLPLDAYQTSPAQGARLGRTYLALLAGCLHRFGVGFVQPGGVRSGPRTPNERRYGLTDPALAGGGYWAGERGLAARPTPPRQAPEFGALAGGGGPAVVRGRRVPAGGCAGEARRALVAGHPAGADRDLGQRLASAVFFAAEREPAVVAATRGWSDCMRAAGFRYAGPLDPLADPRFAGRLTALEVRVARADVACKRRTNLVGVRWAAELAGQRRVLAEHRTALGLTRQAIAAELAVADRTGVR